jgi:hypothetical protein
MPRVSIGSVASLLAVVPYLLGFHPSRSLVVIGADGPRGRIKLGFRYDLPDPPDPALCAEIAEHLTAVLGRQRVRTAIVVGYGPGALVTPVADAVRAALGSARIGLGDLLRVEAGRYWSYLCQNPDCCPAEGVPFDLKAERAAAELTAAGLAAHPDRETLARSIAPVGGTAAESMAQATERALERVADLMLAAAEPAGAEPATARPGMAERATARPGGDGDILRPVVQAGRDAVRDAIAVYRAGGRIADDDQIAWLCVVLADLRVRDDAWARMDPEHREAHQRLWTDVVRRARPEYVPAPAALLAFTAWQSGEGALANMAVDRALEADPGYTMAQLLGRVLAVGLPPSAARLPMTPEEVEASYADTERAARTAAALQSPTRQAAAGRSAAGQSASRQPAARTPRPGSRKNSARKRRRK